MVRQDQIDPETLAALLDGTLPAGERDEVMERLARSPGAFEGFAEAARVLRDLDAEAVAPASRPTDAPSTLPADAPPAATAPAPPPSPPSMREIRPARRFPGAKRWLPLAAVLAAAVLVPRLISRGAYDPGTALVLLDGATLVTAPGDGSLAAGLGPDWDQPGWSVKRGPDDSLADTRLEFRVGVRLTDVEVALDAGDVGAVRAMVDELTWLAGALPASTFVVTQYNDIAARATTGARDDDLNEDRAKAASSLAALFADDSPWFPLGVWLEQARLAARSRRTAFFAGTDRRAALEELARQITRVEGADAPIVRHLSEIDTLLADGVTEDELPGLLQRVTAAIREGGG